MRFRHTFFFLLVISSAMAQVGISNTDPADGTLLHVEDGNENTGVLFNSVQINDLSTAAPLPSNIEPGTMVYNSSGSNPIGLYVWDGSQWGLPFAPSGEMFSLYTRDSDLRRDRRVNLNGNTLAFNNSVNRGLVFMEPNAADPTSPFILQTPNTVAFSTNGNSVMNLTDDTQPFILEDYGSGGRQDNTVQYALGIDSDGMVLESPYTTKTNSDAWYRATTIDNMPTSINDSIYTMGAVAVGRDGPVVGKLNIVEQDGIPATANQGSITIDNDNGLSSLIFRSSVDRGSDGAGIGYIDDGSGNGNSNQNSLLTIMVLNNGPGQFNDDMAISSPGSIGVNNTAPDPSASIDPGATDRGVLINRVSLTNAGSSGPISNPADGTMVYNTNASQAPAGYRNDVTPGFYTWNTNRNRWVRQKNESRSAKWTSEETTFNLNNRNSNPEEVDAYENNEWNDDPSLYQVQADGNFDDLDVQEDGLYRVIFNMAVESTDANPDLNLNAQIEIEGQSSDRLVSVIGSTAFMSKSNGHNHSSIHFDEIVEIQAGEDISVRVSREANTGNVTLRQVGSANFYIEKIR